MRYKSLMNGTSTTLNFFKYAFMIAAITAACSQPDFNSGGAAYDKKKETPKPTTQAESGGSGDANSKSSTEQPSGSVSIEPGCTGNIVEETFPIKCQNRDCAFNGTTPDSVGFMAFYNRTCREKNGTFVRFITGPQTDRHVCTPTPDGLSFGCDSSCTSSCSTIVASVVCNVCK